MYKNIYKLGLAGIVGIGMAMITLDNANADYPTQSRSVTPMNQIVLDPGWRSSCESNFVIQNLGNKKAEVRIVMGKDCIIQDTIQQWDKRGYNLTSRLSFAKQLGKTVNIDDVALIENQSKDSRISINC